MNKYSFFLQFFVIWTKYLHERIKIEIILFQLYINIFQKQKNITKLLHENVHQNV